MIYKITKITCPTCNMTRALLALARGDVKSYIEYNFMAFPVAAAFIGALFSELFGKYRKALNVLISVILLLNIIYYINNIKFN